MSKWTIQDAEELYGIPYWGDGYFGVGEDGNLRVLPEVGNHEAPIALQDVVKELQEQDIRFPVVMRFHDILRNRVRRLNEAFGDAIEEYQYGAPYRGVFPIKVNQMREVVDEIVDAGGRYHYGLEAGSKPELMAVLSCKTSAESLIICNGYKDEDYMRLALLGRKLQRRVVVVIEEFSEIEVLLRLATEMNVRPLIGLRIKMRIKTEGRWADSSGERAKFGLPISGILNAIDLIRARGFGDCICLLHFHVGSQISDIRYVKEAVQEAARVYARLYKRGVPLSYLDIGGGLAVDYDGSQSHNHSSMNYTMEDYARGVVFEVMQICDVEEVPHPALVSESGRSITAHHSCVVMQVMGKVSDNSMPVSTEPVEDEHILVSNMHSLLASLDDRQQHLEIYNDASLLMADILSGFKLGVLGLEELARAETLYWQLMNGIARELDSSEHVSEDLMSLETTTTSQHLCNFSLFQSAADVWAIQQILPIVPLARLNERPEQNCTLADITCDSDGKVVEFIGAQGKTTTLPLHSLRDGEHYFVGMFLTGAYQDVMGDTHNLFGRVNEVHVFCDTQDPSGFYIEEYVPGSSASQVLSVMQYNPPAMAATVKSMIDGEVAAGKLGSREGVKLADFYESALAGYTYLRPDQAHS